MLVDHMDDRGAVAVVGRRSPVTRGAQPDEIPPGLLYRMAKAHRLLRYAEEHGIVRRLPDGLYERIPGAQHLPVPVDQLTPAPQDFEAARHDAGISASISTP
jgi:hypothetical protein